MLLITLAAHGLAVGLGSSSPHRLSAWQEGTTDDLERWENEGGAAGE